MSRRVKRPYESPLRSAHAEQTRRVIAAAAATLFADKGYTAVSVDAVAKAAGVGRATIFASIGGKPDLLRVAYRRAFTEAAGGEIDSPLVDMPRSRDVRAQGTAEQYLESYAALSTEISNHMAGVYEAMREAARAEPEVEKLWKFVNDERRKGAATIVSDVQKRAPLRNGLEPTTAADLVWVLNDPGLFQALTLRRGWPKAHFQAWLAHALKRELLG